MFARSRVRSLHRRRALDAGLAVLSLLLLRGASVHGHVPIRPVPRAVGDEASGAARVADGPVRGLAGDLWADVVLGQPDFETVSPNRVAGNRLFNANGVLVDRGSVPNRVFVYDAGNNRVLGLRHLGACAGGPAEGDPCTSRSDCDGGACAMDPQRPADVVLGQPGPDDHGACNGDSGFQSYPVPPVPSAATLCLLRVDQLSILEGGSAATMAVDGDGNLYVPDFFNHRVLRYDRPFETDGVADHVWGQADFAGQACNRGRGHAGPADASSLCLAPPNGIGTIEAGVAVDADGNLWVTDKLNHRVLRFPRGADGVPAPRADLVLGQPDPSGNRSGAALDRLQAPGSVRVSAGGVVYVADTYNDRVLAYEPPLSSGMAASYVLGEGMDRPPGLEIGPDGDLWVNDAFNRRLVRFRGRDAIGALGYYASGDWGGPGIDRDGNVLQSGWTHQALLHHAAPEPDATAIVPDAFLLRSARNPGVPNEVDGRGLFVVNGMTIAGDQLIVADGNRLLYWNEPWRAANGQPADGAVGQPDLDANPRGGFFGRVDGAFQGVGGPPPRELWALRSGGEILAYGLPLVAGASPELALRSPMSLRGGGTIQWSDSVAIGDVAADIRHDAIWVSDRDDNRVFRINYVSPGQSTGVDVVLGQASAGGRACNRGRGNRSPSQDSLCAPGGIAVDLLGNLFVSDHAREFDGNHRLLMWDAERLRTGLGGTAFGLPASRVFGRGGSFSEPDCRTPLCAPFDPVFDGKHGARDTAAPNRMVVGVNPYISGLANARFPLVFDDILADGQPSAALRDYYSMSLQGALDRFGNLYMSDHNRSRILVYRAPFRAVPETPTHAPTPSSTPAEATPTRAAPTLTTPTSPAPGEPERVFMPRGDA